MPAYCIARCKIDNPVEYKKYTGQVPGIVTKQGGKVLARGGRFQIMEGTDKYHRFVVIEFPSLEKAVECHRSPEYQAAAAYRRAAGVGEAEQVIVESGDATPQRLAIDREVHEVAPLGPRAALIEGGIGI